MLTEVQRELNWVKHQYEQRNGCAVWDVRCKKSLLGFDVSISGHVLIPAQKQAVEKVIARHFGVRVKYHLDIETKSDHDHAYKNSWGQPKADIVDLYSRPLQCERLRTCKEKFRSSQVVTTDTPFRVLLEHQGWLLIKLEDSTLGWVQKDLVDIDRSGVKMSVTHVRSNGASGPRSGPSQVTESANQFLGVRYLLGGVTTQGIDCSGLAQRAYKQAAEVTLPKHSRDQMSCGRGVSFERRELGDLVFFSCGLRRDLHVGVLGNRHKVIHASQRRGAVVVESLSTLPLEIIQVRRILT